MLNNNVTEKKTKDNIVELHIKDPGFSVTEAFNTLRTNIMFSGENIKTVMVTRTNPDEGKSFVVLVEGLVEVSAGKGESRIITPGHMAEVNMYDVQAKILVSKCDSEHYVAWKNGNFSFRNASLTDILKRVSRYYDVTVIREQVFEEEYYTGDVSSDVSLESLLAVIESSTSVSFKVESKIVYVQKKRD